MFSETKVMILLPTSSLTYLVIELIDMGKKHSIVYRIGNKRIYPSAIGASELNVTTPEVVVTGKDHKPSWRRMYENPNLGDTSQYNNPSNVVEGFNILTLGGLNNLSPSQWLRRGYDAVTGNLTADSWINGNAGIVPNSYAKEHPLMSMAANGLVDFWTLGGPKLLKGALSTGTKLNPVQYTKYEPQPIQEPIIKTQITPKQFEIEEIPGYQLKSLMRGNALEKQLSKQGTISVTSIKAHANKASEVEKSVINNVLSSEEFAGQKSIDYNKFRKAVHNNLITYDRTPDARYEDYGLNRLGMSTKPVYQDEPDMINRYNDIITRIHDFELQHHIPRATRRSTEEQIEAVRNWRQSEDGQRYASLRREFDEFMQEHPGFTTANLQLNSRQRLVGHSGDGAKLNTYTFSSDKIPQGNGKHYDSNTLGHSRTYTTEKEPDILHVMESQSDWAQAGGRQILNKANPAPAQEQYLIKNYQQRQIQENLRYAAEHGQTKMRYPTPDTAAKIEGYKKGFTRSDETETISKQISDTQYEYEKLVKLDRDPFDDKDPVNIRLDELVKNLEKLRVQFDEALARTPLDYSTEHRTILKKYADFPKQFKKLHKNAEIREVTDNKGNTWYEVDVPENFLKKEWMYGITGAATIGGASQLKPRRGRNNVTK